jgi:ribosomal peptide maturation radical SAM protein 1
MRVALVVMPFAAADSPSLAAGLLKAELNEQGIECDVKHFNVTMSLLLGAPDYDRISREFQSAALAGEWIFSQLFYEKPISDWTSFRREVLGHPMWGVSDDDLELIRRTAAVAPTLLKVAYEATDWSRYDLVGFTSTFEQTMSSMCLARLIRQYHPRVLLAAGGANFESSMGRALFEHFEFLDFVCDGEGDVSFPSLCRALAEGREDIPPGFHARVGDRIVSVPQGGSGPVDLERLPHPDFDDYFRVVERSECSATTSWIPLEASRGCWWGERHHCTFCGLNGETMAFRQKSWSRVAAETEAIAKRYAPPSIQFTDNILGMEYFDNLLPHWAEAGPDIPKFVETKSNLKRRQIELMRAAGITCVQPGIESFSDVSLARMKKGVTAAQNVALLRWCRESGIKVSWNILYGFPGEQPAELADTHAVMRAITHLDAPASCVVIRLDRFSPNFVLRDSLGLTTVRPMPAYRHVFDLPAEALQNASYFFEYEHPSLAALIEAALPLRKMAKAWQDDQRGPEPGNLELFPHISGDTVLVDSRVGHARRSRRLRVDEARVLLAFDSPTPREKAFGEDVSLDSGIFAWLVDSGAICPAGKRFVTTSVMREAVRQKLATNPRTSRGVTLNNRERIEQCLTT